MVKADYTTEIKEMRIAVIGAGGVGGPFGSALARAGNNVVFLARGAHLAAMQKDGLRVEGALGDFHLNPCQATDDPAAIGPVDFILFTVKLWDVETAGAALAPMIGDHTGVVTLQNGIDAPERLASVIGDKAVMGGVAVINAAIAGPGRITQMGEYQNLTFGERDGRISARGQELLAACEGAGIQARLSENIAKDLWEKFVFLASVAAMTAASRQRMVYIRTDPDARATLTRLLQEVTAVGVAAGISLDADLPAQRLAMIDGQNGESIASMAIDLLRGNRLELPWLAGKAVQLGIEHGVETPALQALTAALRPFEMGAPELPVV
jgi:2-dehydropantoate 2-reductase